MLTATFMLVSCLAPEKEIGDSFELDPKSNGSTVNGLCYNDQYSPEGNIIRKMDIVIVPDTSGSIVEERGAIADGFDAFLNSLPAEVDYRVGVVLGHSPRTQWSGSLYQKGTEPLVLDSQSMDTASLISALNTKMQSPATDNFSDGGEMGLHSLMRALTDNKEAIQAEGFFREDAALAVIFVADEQDICADFPDGVIPVPDPQGGEDRSYNEYCLDGDSNLTVTPQSIVDLIKEHQGDRPFVVGGVIYNNANTISLGGENEIGYGYKEAVELAGGINVDLASGDYGDGLTRLGKMAQVAVDPENSFNLKTAKVDPSTIEVLVDGQSVGYSYDGSVNQVTLDVERGPFSVANVKYCEKEESPLIATKVISGGYHSCAILLDGKVKCWGRNNAGQLGYGHVDTIGDDETLDSIDPIDFGQKVVDMSAGFYHTCAVLEDGSVKCWGLNNLGQLGQGHTDSLGDDEAVSSITAIPLASAAKKIYSGTFYSCALLDNKNVQCWGDNSRGQLGYGHNNNIGDDETLAGLGYVPVGASVVQMDISTISSHSCAALSNGDLKCWGANNNGQLGYGHANDVNDASAVGAVPFGANVLQIATGFNHTCALAGGQKIRCWGSNANGQIGLGYQDIIGDDESADSVGFIDISGDGTDTYNMVASGNNHTCGVSVSNEVFCWGDNTKGATGIAWAQIIGDDEQLNLENTKVNLDKAVSQVSGGALHTCALTKDEGEVICWGYNVFGQLGIGNTDTIGDNEDPSAYVSLAPAQ